MSLNTTNAVNVNISTTEDSSGAIDITRNISQSYDSNLAQLVSYAFANVALISLMPSLAVGSGFVAFQVYIKNNDANNQLAVVLTPLNGVAANVVYLNPQDFILIWQKTGGAVNGGFSNVQVGASVGSRTQFEYFIGG
jgi:hypothetical protein